MSFPLAGRAMHAVMRLVNLLQPLLDDVSVNLSGRNICMPEHELNGPESALRAEQVRGKNCAAACAA